MTLAEAAYYEMIRHGLDMGYQPREWYTEAPSWEDLEEWKKISWRREVQETEER